MTQNPPTDRAAEAFEKNVLACLNEAAQKKFNSDSLSLEDLIKTYDEIKYPELGLVFRSQDITSLFDEAWFSERKEPKGDHPPYQIDIDKLLSRDSLSPIARLYVAMAWKNGDLRKVEWIYSGMNTAETTEEFYTNTHHNKAVVFFQFGKHLKDRSEPIIDINILRAFASLKSNGSYQSGTTKLNLSNSTITKGKAEAYFKYISWFKGAFQNLNEGDLRFIDKALFSLGKALKPLWTNEK